MKYREKLWNNYELIYGHFNQRRKSFKDLVTMIYEIHNINCVHAMNLKKIHGEGYAVTNEGTLGKSAKTLNEHLIHKYLTFCELSYHIKNEIVEPAKKFLDEQTAIGKKLYSDMKKIERDYKDSCAYVEKAKGKFMMAARTAEKDKLDSELGKISSDISVSDKEKLHTKSMTSMREAKEQEKLYLSAISGANSIRVAYIDTSQNILTSFEVLEKEYIENTREILEKFYTYSNNAYKSIIDNIERNYITIGVIDVDKDIQTFVEPNQTNECPPNEIEYQPYQISLQSKPIGELNYSPDIVYNVIVSMQTTFEKTCEDCENQPEEQKQIQIQEISQQACMLGDKMTHQNKKLLFQLLKEKKYRLTFLLYLNKQRIEGKFTLTRNCYKLIGEVLYGILNEVAEEDDFESAKFCIILSQTYHYIDTNNQKVFLQKVIECHPLLKKITFWEGFLNFNINEELEKNSIGTGISNEDKENQSTISHIVFAQILPITYNMLEFAVNKDDLIKLIDCFNQKYEISDNDSSQIQSIIEEREYKTVEFEKFVEKKSSKSMKPFELKSPGTGISMDILSSSNNSDTSSAQRTMPNEAFRNRLSNIVGSMNNIK